MLSAIANRCGGIGRERPHATGFTLIELMVVVAVIAVASTLAAPSFIQQFANYRVRSAAEAIVNGLNYARGEAVRRNTPVSFSLDASGSGWSVAQVSPSTTLQTRSGGDSPNVITTSSTSSRSVTFLPTGLVDTSGVRMSQVTITYAATSTQSRRIDILGGGLIRMCDPAVSAANDPRRC